MGEGGGCGERDATRGRLVERIILWGKGHRVEVGVRGEDSAERGEGRGQTPSTGLRHAGKRCSECRGRCRKAVLGVWRKVPESGARGVEEGAGKRCSECGGRCRKAVLGVWRKVPESGARSVRRGDCRKRVAGREMRGGDCGKRNAGIGRGRGCGENDAKGGEGEEL